MQTMEVRAMLKTERWAFILKTVNRNGTVSLRDLEQQLHVSRMTLRRDVNEMAEKGQLIRIRGGAQSVHQQGHELARRNKTTLNLPAKRAIAKVAVNRIQPNATIYIGPGTTLERMSEFFVTRNVRIVTSSLPVFNAFRHLKVRDLVMVGGFYREMSDTFIGSIANEMIQKLNFQASFISLNGLADERLMTANSAEGELQRLALEHAQQRIVLADASKFERNDFYTFYALARIDELITDSSLSPELQKKYQQLTALTVAPPLT